MASFSMSRSNVGSSPSINWTIFWGLQNGTGYFHITCQKNADGYISGGGFTCYLTVDGTTYNFYMACPTGATGSTATSTIYLNDVSAPTRSSSISFYTTSQNYSSTGIVPSSNPITGTFYYNIKVEDRVDNSAGSLLGSGSYSVAVATNTTPSTLRNTTYTGYTYSSQSPFSFSVNSDKTVYRFFVANTYIISYNANGITGDTTTKPADQTKTYGVALTLSSTKATRYCTVTFNTGGGSTISPINSSRTFQSWNTAAGGTGTTYQPGGSYTANSAVTLYAQWNSSYATITLPTPTKADSIFKGWYTASSGGTRVGGGGSSYTPTASIILYAQWESGVVRIYTGSSFITFVPYVYHNGTWVRAIPNVYNNGSWKVSV